LGRYKALDFKFAIKFRNIKLRLRAKVVQMKPSAHQTPSVQVLARAFSVLDVLATHQEPVSLKIISEKTGLHPSTAHRILNDLVSGRLVDRPESGTYRLGMRLLELGNLVKARLDVREAALIPMRELHKLTQQPVNLSMRQGDEIVYIERAYSERSGTLAARRYPDDISPEVKNRRLNEIIALQNKHALQRNLSDVGKIFTVLIEKPSKRSDSDLCGRTDQNKMVVFPAENYQPGQYVEVLIESATSASLKGKVLKLKSFDQ
jgi:hypothetical protein